MASTHSDISSRLIMTCQRTDNKMYHSILTEQNKPNKSDILIVKLTITKPVKTLVKNMSKLLKSTYSLKPTSNATLDIIHQIVIWLYWERKVILCVKSVKKNWTQFLDKVCTTNGRQRKHFGSQMEKRSRKIKNVSPNLFNLLPNAIAVGAV